MWFPTAHMMYTIPGAADRRPEHYLPVTRPALTGETVTVGGGGAGVRGEKAGTLYCECDILQVDSRHSASATDAGGAQMS